MNLKQCYATLEVHHNADKGEIRQAYRDLVIIWHPDQYQETPRLQKKATEKLKELNTAHDTLMVYLEARPAKPANPANHQGTPEKQAKPRANHRAGQQKRKSPFALWIVLLAAVAITALALCSRWPFPLPGKTRQGSIANEGSSIHALATARLDLEQIVGLQQDLALMGYDSGPADGKMGPQTITAVQQFAMDFQVDRGGNFVDALLATSSRQAAVTRIHADWPEVSKSRGFQNWIENQNIASPDVCRNVLASGSTAQVTNLIHSFMFDREAPEPIKLPETGIVEKRFYQGMAPLTIKTRNEGLHFFIKLLELPEQKEVLATFIRSGDMLKLRIPLGVYALKYAVGNTWYGTRWLFGSKTVYSRIEKDIAFTFGGSEISGYSIELYVKPTPLSKKNRSYAFDF